MQAVENLVKTGLRMYLRQGRVKGIHHIDILENILQINWYKQ